MDEILTEVTETTVDIPEIQTQEVEAIDITVDSVDQVENELDPKTQQPQLGTVVTNAVIGSLVGYGMSIVLPAVGRAVCKGIKVVGNKIKESKENKKAKASKIEEEVEEVDVNLEEIEVEVELDEK